MENTIVDFVVGKIAGEMSAEKRWTLSKQFAESIKADKVETFRKVEAITEAKDKGTLLEVLDAGLGKGTLAARSGQSC